MCSNFLILVTMRAVVFCWRWSLLMSTSGCQRGDCYNCPVTMSQRRVWAARLHDVAACVECAQLSRYSCNLSDTGSSHAPSYLWQKQRWHQGCEQSHWRWRWCCQLKIVKWLSHPHDDVTSGYTSAKPLVLSSLNGSQLLIIQVRSSQISVTKCCLASAKEAGVWRLKATYTCVSSA